MNRNHLLIGFLLSALVFASGLGLARVGRPTSGAVAEEVVNPPPSMLGRTAPSKAEIPDDLFGKSEGESTTDRIRRLLKFVKTASPGKRRKLKQVLTLRAELYHDIVAYFVMATMAAEEESSPERRLAMHSGLAIDDIKKRIRLLREWAKTDPEAAFQYALADPAKAVLHEMLEKILSEAAGIDAELAYRLLGQIEDKDLQASLRQNAVAGIVRLNPKRYAEFAKTYPAERQWIRQVAFWNWANDDPTSALKALEKIWPVEKEVIDSFLAGWAGHSPEVAAAWATEHGFIFPRFAMETWTKKDPEAALAHLSNFKSEFQRREALKAAAKTWATTAPEDAIAWATENLEGAEQTLALKEILNRTGSIDGKTRPDWMKTLAIDLADHANPYARREVHKMLRNWRPSSAARDWVMKELPTGTQRLYMARLLPDWIGKEPAAAKAYLQGLPTARARAFVIDQSIEGKWDQQDKIKEWARKNLDAETQALTRILNPPTP